MRYVVALFFPWIAFFTIRQFGKGFLCLLLQISVVGWIPAVIWAVASVAAYNEDKRTDRLVDAIAKNNPAGKPIQSAPNIPEYAPPPRPREAAEPIPTVESYLRSRPGGSAPRSSAEAEPRSSGRQPDYSTERSYDERKWRALIRFDDEISAAAKLAREFGAQWEDELARSYLRLNDKSYLDALVDKVAKEARARSA